ncbi:PKD-like domain-containing protein [Mucilaginibacter sp. cycad4]|uniref:Ig-like domain-containing protein n=1 Tax=Mucilaginibacter sp. cycad4 TaxID=3342096 RepID=UPI002AABCC0D|nr:PKD-like domain-containing protein [Mucilaginibacter gossypii]WPU99430.1 PKD-like domain-containing protein [Mucilaginibacter gossypii]
MKNINKPLLVLFLLIICSFAGYSQVCTLNVTISSTANTICSGKNVTLTANLSGGTGPFTYIWNTGENTPSIDVNKAGTYTVTVSDKTPGCQPKVASFSVTAVASPNPPTVGNQVVCPNTSATLTATAPGGTYQWYDADGNFLFTGNPYVTAPITQGTVFYVETTIGSCTSTRSSVVVNVTGRPTVQADPVCSGSSATLIASGADSYAWYANSSGTGTPLSNNATFITPALTANTTYYLFTVIKGCASSGIPVVARINAPPPAPVVGSNSVCSGSSINLHADAEGVVEWYDVPSGGTPLISSPDYTTPALTSPVTYYVQTRTGDCTSNRIAVPVSVTPVPAAPPSQSPATCYGTSVTLTADPSPTGTYNWYTAATGGSSVGTGNTFQTPVLTSDKTYYVEHTTGGCTSGRTPVTVTVTPAPEQPIVPDGPIICNGSSTSLTATSAQSGTFQWFTAATGGTSIFSGDTFITPALTATTTYYVQTTVGACISDRSAITVTVLDPIPAPAVQPVPAICSGTAATLTATGSPDDYEWYDQATGGNLLITGNTYVTPELTANATYYVQSTANGCSGPRTAVTVQVNPPPAAPTVNGTATVCPGEPASLSAPASGETIQWYTDAAGGTPVHTGNTYTTDPLFAQTTFYAQAVNGTCVSPRTAFTVSITPVIDPQFRYPSGTICTSGSNVAPVIYNPAGGTFSSTPGLVFVSNTTGEINVAASTTGKYTIAFTYGGTCAGTASQSISIVTTPDATFSYDTPICNNVKNPLPVFQPGASAGVFSESTGNIVFKNASTGEIDLDKSHTGTYIVTNTIAASSGCAQSIATSQITIYNKVMIYAGPDQTVQQGVPVQLAGNFEGGATSVKWTGGAGTFSDPTDKNAIYTPAPGEKTVKLTLTSDNPAGPCLSKSSTVTITINPVPAAPTAPGKSVCKGSTTNLTATAPGGTYRWYSDATGGPALKVGPIFTTPPILNDITYYVETTVGGITSKRTPVLVQAVAPPSPPVVTQGPVCEGQPATLTASGSTGTYTWYNVPVGGSPIKQGNPFTTTNLTTNRTYYVETKVNDCTSERTKVDVVVTPAPNITSGNSDVVCSGTALNYTMTADQPGTTFSWDRPAVAGISNPAVTGQTTSSITETLINTNPSGAAVDVTYNITPYLNGCPGPIFNYTVTVNALPTVTSAPPGPVCNGTSTNYQAQFSSPVMSFTWSRAAVDGISNAAVTGQAAPTIKEVLYNTTNTPIEVTYIFNYKTSSCTATPYELKVTVNPGISITNETSSEIICNNTPLAHTITSNIPSATFLWSRPAVPGITNAAVTDQTANPINETLVNTLTTSVQVPYTIIPVAFGCQGAPVKYTVTVRPQTLQIEGHSNSPVCEGNDIILQTQPIAGATYLWTGPNNFRSEGTTASVTIPKATAANAGTYSLYLIVNDCPGEPSMVPVEVHSIPIVDAGGPQTVCVSAPYIQLDGSVQSATGTGTWTGGSLNGFSKQDDLKARYTPTTAERNAGSVTLTLTSTGKDDCAPVSRDVTITFAPNPGADAGPTSIDNVCIQSPMVPLNGQVFSGTTVKWTSASGLGRFIPSDNVLNPTFQPDPIDIANGSVKLTLTATQADDCHTPTDDITINFVPPPTVQADAAGDTRYVLKGHTITLNPVVGSENVTYEWTPATGLDNATVKNPIVTGDQDIIYKLKITDKSNGCVNESQVAIKVAPVITINNTFTPNSDGVNDYWEIKGLVAYENSTVDVYNRYGQLLFHSVGYPKPWDGTYQGKAMPSGTYYYVVNTKMNNVVLSGYVVILR